jgi:hypothetical protein
MKLEEVVQFGTFAIIAAVAVVWSMRLSPQDTAEPASAQSAVAESEPQVQTESVGASTESAPVEFVPPEEGFLTATSLTFTQAEPGIAPYTTRVLVTKDFVRFDDGYDGSDYVLYDRRVRSIYSVAHGNRMILQILHREMLLPQPEDLQIKVERKELEDAPPVAERQPVQIVYSVNGASCQQAIVVPDLLPDVAAALREYEQTLAGQSYSTLENTPPELRSPCFLASNLFIAGEYLESGLPLQTSNYSGEQKLLTGYQQGVDMPSSLFDLNDEYFIMSLNQSF